MKRATHRVFFSIHNNIIAYIINIGMNMILYAESQNGMKLMLNKNEATPFQL